ncbi:MAG: NAD(P) transhydrogenase subunit alpha [Holosporales bacterium]
MGFDAILFKLQQLSQKIADLGTEVSQLDQLVQSMAVAAAEQGGGNEPLIQALTVFVLACFVGYYVVWRVTPALHSPLMAVTNAISSVIIVGALFAAGLPEAGFSKLMGFLAVVMAAVNIFGGFIVTQRMLHMFSKKK